LTCVALVTTFLVGAGVSLGASWLLVSRLERIGDRLGVSEALLGLLAALAADAPEVTAAVTALVRGEHQVGAGVVIGSNVFNLAALLGLSAVVAGAITLHRRVVLFAGAVAVWIAGACLLAVTGAVAPWLALAFVLAAVVSYGAVLGTEGRGLGWLPVPRPWLEWLTAAVAEEEQELEGVVDPHRATPRDAIVAGLSLMLVIGGSVAMERAASALGESNRVPQIVVGGLVLAVVTSLPNAVAAVYLAARGRGAAVLSTALNSNAFNILVGLLLPATIFGLGAPSGPTILTAAWYAGLTVVALALAYGDRGLRRGAGALIIASYCVFAGSLLLVVLEPEAGPWLPLAGGGVVVLAAALPLIGHAVARLRGRESLLPGWPAHRLWALGIASTALVAAVDALLGNRVVLIGLLIVGPCCALLTGRWVPTASTAGLAIGLAVLLGVPDGIWASAAHLEFVGAVVVVALANTAAAAITDRLRS
jgi:cation:H+ antiporter